MVTARGLAIVAAGAGSAAMLLAALGFQFLGGLPPCQLCLWQRWPHLAAVVIALLWLATRWRLWPWLGALAVLTTAGIGLFHVGVEQGWWEFISSCTQGSLVGESGASLLPGASVDVVLPVRCDRIAWSFVGLSMAAWNAILSFGLAGLWLAGALLRKGAR